MNGRFSRWSAGAAALAALGTVLWFVVPLGFASSAGTKAQSRAAVTCQQSTGPAFPLELNTVSVQTLAKTVAMEKHIYNCTASPTGGGTVTRDVETFVEVIERETATNVIQLNPRVVSVICDKSLATGAVNCKRTNITVTTSPNPPLSNQCSLAGTQPTDPVEMNSVVVDNNWVKTIKVEKEIYSCNDGTTMNDLYLFTELLERKNVNGDNFDATIVRFSGVFCQRGKFDGVISGCIRFTPGLLP